MCGSHDMLPQNGPEPNKNASMMENHIFRKSHTKDEYLGLVAKLFMHYKDASQRKSQPQQQRQQQQQQQQQLQQQQQQPAPSNAEMGQQNIMQDPLNALQNLASQGNRNPQLMPMGGAPGPNQMAGPGGPGTASNLLQTLNQQRPGQQQMQPMPNIRGQLPMGAGAGGQQMVQVQQMAGGNGPGGGAGGMQLNAMGPAVSQGQGQIVGNAGGMPNQMVGPGPNSGPTGGAAGGMPNQMSPMVVSSVSAYCKHFIHIQKLYIRWAWAIR